MSIDNTNQMQTYELLQNNDDSSTQPDPMNRKKGSNPMGSFAICFLCLALGLGVGLGVLLLFPMDGSSKSKPSYSASKKKESGLFEWFESLVFSDDKNSRSKKKTYGPFRYKHRKSDPDLDLPQPVQVRSPFEPTPTISF